jgi:hypothetical protein
MDQPVSHQVLVNKKIRTPLRGSSARSLLEENMQDLLLGTNGRARGCCGIKGVAGFPARALKAPDRLKSPALWGFYFLPM